MEDPSSIFCNQLRSFCSHLQLMCNNLKTSMHQRPVPLDSTFSSFLEGLDRRVTSTNKQVEALESMTIDTISFEELLGHCNELYKQNETALACLEHRLKEYGYEPVLLSEEIPSSEEPSPSKSTSPRSDRVSELEDYFNRSLAIRTPAQTPNSKKNTPAPALLPFTPASIRASGRTIYPEDSLFEESLSLQDLGLSDACLATLASEGNRGDDILEDVIEKQSKDDKHMAKEISLEDTNVSELPLNSFSLTENHQNLSEGLPKVERSVDGVVTECILNVSKTEYDKAPSWLRGLASWEDLDDAIGKINGMLMKRTKRGTGNGAELFDQDALEPLALGPKAKAYLLLLVRMNHLTIEYQDGVTMYRINSK